MSRALLYNWEGMLGIYYFITLNHCESNLQSIGIFISLLLSNLPEKLSFMSKVSEIMKDSTKLSPCFTTIVDRHIQYTLLVYFLISTGIIIPLGIFIH